MKKILFCLVVALFSTITTNAMCINRNFCSYEGGECVAQIILTSDCKFIISSVDGDYHTGTYTIRANGKLEPGAQYDIIFYLSDGDSVVGNYMCPLQGKQCVDLDGFFFEAV